MAPPEDIARYRGKFKDGWDVLRERRLERMQTLGIVSCALSPRTPGVPAWDTLTPEENEAWQRRMEIHAAMVDRMDREIGRVLDQVRKNGAWENTLIFFASDNGASAEKLVRGDRNDPSAPPGSARSFLCIEPPWANLANAPLRKSKIFTHEGGIATPLIVHWPAGFTPRGALRHTPGHLVDIVPTLLELTDAPIPTSFNGEPRPPLSGRSLVPALANDARIEHDGIWWHHQGNRAFRLGDWKIVASGPETPWELYDLATDRGESHDLAAEQPERVRAMAALWATRDAEYQKQGATGGDLPCRQGQEGEGEKGRDDRSMAKASDRLPARFARVCAVESVNVASPLVETRAHHDPTTPRLLVFLAFLVIFVPSVASAHAQDADLILHNGKVVTVDRDFSIRQALAVKGGRLIRVGTDDEVLKARGPNTKVVDLGGKTVLPGLIDSHTHPTGASMTEFDHPVPEMETIEDVLDYVRGAGRGAGQGEVGRRPPGLHHPAEGAALSDPRRARPGRAR